MTTTRISLGYKPRAQFVAYHKRKQRWACIVAHRRAGKSVACIMDLINATLKSKKPDARFGYVAPTYTQAKDVVWSYLKEYTHRIPGVELRESDLSVILPTGARIRLYGSDNHDRLRGIYLDGVVLDEYADMAPQAWAQVIRPALADRKGWATFIGTPKGRNSFFEIYDYARHNPDEWFSLELRADETGILDDDELDSARRVLTTEQFAQEFLCSFDAAILGSYFGKELDAAQQAGRIGNVAYDPLLPVHTAWDLGIGDSTAIWFFQVSRAEVRVIDHYEAAGHGLPHYAAVLASRGYTYGTDYLPHDAQARQLGTGRSLWETLHGLTNRIPRILPQQNVMDGINAARVTIGSAWFDADKCHDGLEALRAYRADYDDKRKAFTDRPRHDWASHCFHGETNILTRHGMCRIMDLPQTGEVLTPCGWRAYRNPRVTMRDAQLAEVVFSDGHTVRCTPDHLFLTVGGWKSACDLATGSQIQSSLTLSRSISMAASIAYGRARNIYREAAQSCTAMFGRLRSVLSQNAATSIIETTIHSTMPYPTWNARMEPSTYPGPGQSSTPSARSSSVMRPAPKQQSGTSPTLGVFGTAGTPNGPRDGRNGGGKTSRASNAERSRRCWSERAATLSGSVAATAKPLTIAGVELLRECADVWDITVPGVECFSLANGAVVHNSADSFRYLALAWREMQPEKPKPPPVDTWERAFHRASQSEVAGWRVA